MKNIVFLTGTRADYGKLKPLIRAVSESEAVTGSIIVTGMHLIEKYGLTVIEVEKDGLLPVYKNEDKFYKDNDIAYSVSQTTYKIAEYLREVEADLLVVHGDRADALSGTIAALGSNIKIAHIEGGEITGTLDEMFRHAISKLSHLHFVSNEDAKQRLVRLGEIEENVHVIGSPELDILSSELPDIDVVKEYYDIVFNHYSVLVFHPVSTEIAEIEQQIEQLCKAVLWSDRNYIVIYPNNDPGGELIFKGYEQYLFGQERFKFLPSMRFEYFLSILKHADFIVGNSSCGIKEAPFFGVCTINVGSRQNKRTANDSIINVEPDREAITIALDAVARVKDAEVKEFGDGKSAERFIQIITALDLDAIEFQKTLD